MCVLFCNVPLLLVVMLLVWVIVTFLLTRMLESRVSAGCALRVIMVTDEAELLVDLKVSYRTTSILHWCLHDLYNCSP